MNSRNNDVNRAAILSKIGARFDVAPDICAIRLLPSHIKDEIKGFLSSEIIGPGLTDKEINQYGIAADDLIDEIGF